MSNKKNPYLHDSFDVKAAVDALVRAAQLNSPLTIKSDLRPVSPYEMSMLTEQEMGIAGGAKRKYQVILSYLIHSVAQSQLPALQKCGKTQGMVLYFEAADVGQPGVPELRIRVCFVAYTDVLV